MARIICCSAIVQTYQACRGGCGVGFEAVGLLWDGSGLMGSCSVPNHNGFYQGKARRVCSGIAPGPYWDFSGNIATLPGRVKIAFLTTEFKIAKGLREDAIDGSCKVFFAIPDRHHNGDKRVHRGRIQPFATVGRKPTLQGGRDDALAHRRG